MRRDPSIEKRSRPRYGRWLAFLACISGLAVLMQPVAGLAQTPTRPRYGDRQDWDPRVYRSRSVGIDVGPKTYVWENGDHVFSWLHWWELNRLDFLAETRAWLHGEEPVSFPGAASMRAIAAESLHAWLPDHAGPQDTSDRLLAEVILALGRMQDPRWRDRLTAEPAPWLGHPAPRVRTSAWLSLGLLARPHEPGDAVWALLLAPPEGIAARGDEVSLAAQAAAWGLLETPQPEARQALRAMLNQRLPHEAHRMALQALRVHAEPEDERLFLAWLEQAPGPFHAQEAMLGLGAFPSRAGLAAMLQELEGVGSARREREATFRRLDRLGEDPRRYAVPRLRSELRTAAALGLASYPSDRRAWQRIQPAAYRNGIYTTGDGRNEFFRGPAWLLYARTAFYRRGQEQGHLAALEEGLRGRRRVPGHTQDPWSDHVDRWNASRAFAAIGMGLYLRRMAPGTRMAEAQPYPLSRTGRDRHVRQSFQTLTHLVQARREARELRAAAALALGLSAQPEAIDAIHPLFDALQPTDGMVAGALVAALGLLGDPAAEERGIETMRRYGQAVTWYDPWSRRTGEVMRWVEPVFGWRLALLGRAAVLEGQMPEAIWREQVGAHPFVAEEVARLERLRGGMALTPMLVEVLANTDSSDRRIVAARALGERWASDPPRTTGGPLRPAGALDRLARLTAQANHTLSMRWEADGSAMPAAGRDLYPLPWVAQASNLFLYDFLLTLSGSDDLFPSLEGRYEALTP